MKSTRRWRADGRLRVAGVRFYYVALPRVPVWKVADKLVPTKVTAPMITAEISAAIKPYSMAVAPTTSCVSLLKCEHVHYSCRAANLHSSAIGNRLPLGCILPK